MKALLYADLLNIRQLSKTLAALFVFFTVVAFASHSISFLSMALVMVAIMLPINLMSYDKAYGWDQLALSLPVVRRGVVCSKYLASMLFLGTALALTLVLSFVLTPLLGAEPFPMVAGVLLFCAGVSLLMIAVMLPVLYKFGVEKGRYAIMIIVWVPILAMLLLKNSGMENPLKNGFSALDALSSQQMLLGSLVFLVASLLCFALSAFVSMCIYQKKEF